MAKIKPILPGEILEEEFLIPMGISPYKLAKDIKISATRVSEIIKGKRRITIDTALRLSKYFGNSVEFWVGIQADYEIRKAKKVLEKQLAQICQREVVVA
ncbi:MAG: HigA family addiction module antitoxin [Treponema sp.]|nr:HigA family addiction module antitoxin [Treponema sp.]